VLHKLLYTYAASVMPMIQQRFSIHQLLSLAEDVLAAHKTSRDNAQIVAQALVSAECDGLISHGLSRLPAYAAQSEIGKVSGFAKPQVERVASAALRVDAKNGFAFPAIQLGIRELVDLINETGIAAATITRSHHFGVAGHHAERLAQAGLIGLIFGNSPKAMAPWGGSKGLYGTNPIAFAAPRKQEEPLVIDLSLSKVARGKVMTAKQQGKQIPEGWALDKHGKSTTDPTEALDGTMLPIGDAKGSALALMVEILSAALTGANFGFEASSFFTSDGEPPGVGQLMIAMSPELLSAGSFFDRLESLIDAILQQSGTRLPGSNRLLNRKKAQELGIEISNSLYLELAQLKKR
jgi:(2R)-3-sulfolactate dehydrogenase (NADP+)